MKYRSVCTGIAAETVAWHPLGWTPLSFSEIDPFCCSLLTHHYPEVRNYGDFTKIKAEGLESTDLLMGGTPCQSFSIAGKRSGLDDPRGNLALEFIRLAQRLRPRWLVWENVQGVRSSWSDETEYGIESSDFDTFLKALADCGYGFAYRVLDAQYDGLAQRRERVFVVGYLGDWRPPAAVLFERESLRRDTAPGRKTGQEVAGTIGGHTHKGGSRPDGLDSHGAYIPVVAAPLTSSQGRQIDNSDRNGGPPNLIPVGFHGAQITSKANRSQPRDQAPTLNSDPRLMVFDCLNGTDTGEKTLTLQSGGSRSYQAQPILVNARQDPVNGPLCQPLDGNGYSMATTQGPAVRRLTPKEWERLMGFADDYTLIPYPRLKLAADGPRYKAIGNSISVPTLRWIGRRIQTVEVILVELYTK